MSLKPILPGSTLGVMGGGQLGQMFVHAAQQMGYTTAVLDPDSQSPAGLVSHHHVQSGYSDAPGLARMAELCAAITTEFENVPAASLNLLAVSCSVAPSAQSVAIAQDRAREKAFFQRCGIACAPYAVIETPEQLASVDAELLPGILKTSRLGYDGKGQDRVQTREELVAAWQMMNQVPCVLEKILPLADEVSVIVARGRDGQMVHLPPQRNRHRDGILAVTEVFEGNVPASLAAQAIAAAKSIALGIDYVGVLCVEFFVLENGRLIVNEIAPRPHNSGHYSMDACDVSQFELQVRTLANLPLTLPRLHSPAIMLNLLGDLWFLKSSSCIAPPWDAILMLPGTHLHLYGKTDARRGRKMGHLNITGSKFADVKVTALKACALLGVEAF